MNQNEKKLYAVLGFPIHHSLSPKIHQFWLNKHKINANYTALPVKADYLSEIFTSLPKMGFYGVNLTLPLKEVGFSLCDELSDAAQKIGAVNMIKFKDNKVYGHNTDADGFIQSLKKQANWQSSRKTLLIGAGGAARAVLYGLLNEHTPHIVIYNRTKQRAEKLRDDFMAQYQDAQIDIVTDLDRIEGIDLIINSSSCGTNGVNDLNIDFSFYSSPITAYDLVYNPQQTKFLRDAEDSSHQAINGLGMLYYQAAFAFKGWFGEMPEIDDDLHHYVNQ